jgi:hypothetical protein
MWMTAWAEAGVDEAAADPDAAAVEELAALGAPDAASPDPDDEPHAVSTTSARPHSAGRTARLRRNGPVLFDP